jgi:hypothetical protein
MTGVRLTVQIDAGQARAATRIGTLADELGIDSIWVGSLGAQAEASAETLVSLAALAATTEHVRVGAVLDAIDPGSVTELAEEIGVVDQASGGRLELIVRADSGEGLLGQAGRLYGAWTGLRLPDGRVVGVTPPPHQPALPMIALCPDGTSEGVGPGFCVSLEGAPPAGRRPAEQRLAVWVNGPPSIEAAPDDESAEVTRLVEQLARCGATELVVPIAPASTTLTDDLRFLAGVVRPALRASSHETELVIRDALAWYSRLDS